MFTKLLSAIAGTVSSCVLILAMTTGLHAQVPSPNLVNGDFENGLSGWQSTVSGGSVSPGFVSPVAGQARFNEGDAALVELSQDFIIPPAALTLSFDFFEVPGFDLSGGFIPDAFEAALLDSNLNPLIPEWAPFATSSFNFQESGAVNLALGTTFVGTRVSMDISSVPMGTQATLRFTLVGADTDQGSAVTVDGVELLVTCNGQASWSRFGPGIAGTLGVPSCELSTMPRLGSTLDYTVMNSLGTPTNACTAVGMAVNPVMLGNGVLFQVDLMDVRTFLVDYAMDSVSGRLSFAIPSNPAWCGMSFYFQTGIYDTGGLQGLAMTEALMATVGY